MAGKFGNFQIGVDLDAQTLRDQTAGDEGIWPSILKHILTIGQGLGMKPPGQGQNQATGLADYEARKKIDAKYRPAPKAQPRYKGTPYGIQRVDSGDGGETVALPDPDEDYAGPESVGYDVGQDSEAPAATGEPMRKA